MAKEIKITYDTIYEKLRLEKVHPELQELDKNFLKDLAEYIKEKKDILNSQEQKDNVFAKIEIEKTKKQLRSINRILKELYEKRENKIIELALIASRTKQENIQWDTLLPEEKLLFETLVKDLNKFREDILINTQENNKPKDINTSIEEKNKLVRFLHPLPKFVGTDLQIYGPFEEQDIANIPEEIAEILIKNQRAEILK